MTSVNIIFQGLFSYCFAMLLLLLSIYGVNTLPASKGIVSLPWIENTNSWKSCEKMPCLKDYVCVMHISAEYTGPLCVKAGTSTCANVKCIAGFHCIHEEVFCKKAPCYPQPICVPTDENVDRYESSSVIKPEDKNGNPDAGNSQTSDCKTAGCTGGQICVNDGSNNYCRLPLKCDDIACSAENHCRPGEPANDAVCVAACAENEHWDACGGCEGTCQEPEKACDTVCIETAATCRCNSPLIRGPHGICIDPKDCPGKNNGIPTPHGLFFQCAALSCSSGQTCIYKALKMRCGVSDAKCNCAEFELCVIEIVQCFVPPCDPKPICVPVINPGGPIITIPPTDSTPPPFSSADHPCSVVFCAPNTICIEEKGQAKCVPPKSSPYLFI